MSKFIGANAIKSVYKIDGNKSHVVFRGKEKQEFDINTELLEMITTDSVGVGTVLDVVMTVLARNFLAQMAYYDLEMSTVENVATSMRNITINLREELFSKTFDCQGSHNIKIQKLLEIE